MSPGYPNRTAALNSSISYNMFFGGEPTLSYTTMTLHSSPGLLSGAILQMKSGKWTFVAFSADINDPVSLMPKGDNLTYMYDTRNSTTQRHAAFLFSFKGRYTALTNTRNLGVILDRKSAFYHLKRIQSVKADIPKFMLETPVHAVHGLITSPVDFFYYLFSKLLNNSLNKLQTVQNTYARFLNSTKQRNSDKEEGQNLHWLFVNR